MQELFYWWRHGNSNRMKFERVDFDGLSVTRRWWLENRTGGGAPLKNWKIEIWIFENIFNQHLLRLELLRWVKRYGEQSSDPPIRAVLKLPSPPLHTPSDHVDHSVGGERSVPGEWCHASVFTTTAIYFVRTANKLAFQIAVRSKCFETQLKIPDSPSLEISFLRKAYVWEFSGESTEALKSSKKILRKINRATKGKTICFYFWVFGGLVPWQLSHGMKTINAEIRNFMVSVLITNKRAQLNCEGS